MVFDSPMNVAVNKGGAVRLRPSKARRTPPSALGDADVAGRLDAADTAKAW